MNPKRISELLQTLVPKIENVIGSGASLSVHLVFTDDQPPRIDCHFFKRAEFHNVTLKWFTWYMSISDIETFVNLPFDETRLEEYREARELRNYIELLEQQNRELGGTITRPENFLELVLE